MRAGLTQLQVARSVGINASTYSCYETDKRQPDLARLSHLALVLHVTVDELLGLSRGSDPSPLLPATSVTTSELELVKKMRSLDMHGKRLVRLVVDEELIRAQDEEEPESVPFRISEQPAAAGLGAYLGPEAFRTVRVRSNVLPRRAAFGVPVQGDSMEPRFHDGDVLVVSDLLPEQGDIGVFMMDGAGYVKLLGNGELISLNPAYAPIPMTENIRASGKVIGVLSQDDLIG